MSLMLKKPLRIQVHFAHLSSLLLPTGQLPVLYPFPTDPDKQPCTVHSNMSLLGTIQLTNSAENEGIKIIINKMQIIFCLLRYLYWLITAGRTYSTQIERRDRITPVVARNTNRRSPFSTVVVFCAFSLALFLRFTLPIFSRNGIEILRVWRAVWQVVRKERNSSV